MSIIYFGSCGEDYKFTKNAESMASVETVKLCFLINYHVISLARFSIWSANSSSYGKDIKKGCTKILILIHPRIGDDDWSGSDHGGDSGGGGYGLEVAEAVDKERPASFGCLEVLHDVIADLVGIQRDDFAGDAVCFLDLCGKCGIGIDAYAHKTRIRIFARLRCVGYKTVGHTRSCVGCRPEIEEHLVSF